MDNFKEEVAVRRNQGLYNLLFALNWVLIAVLGATALIGLQGCLSSALSGAFDVWTLALTLASGGLAFILWRGKDNLRTEYEYTFTNGDLDVAKVLNNQKRKYLTAINMKNVEAAGAVNTPAFQRYVTMPDIKKHNWFLNRDAHLYYYYFIKNGVKHLIVLEFSQEMAELTHKPHYMNTGVWQG